MPARYETIAKWATEYGWKHGAELGLFDGRTFLHVLKHCPNVSVVGVDVWDPKHRERTGSGERCFCPYCAETRTARYAEGVHQMHSRVMRQSAPYGVRAVILQMTTDAASELVANHSLDWVFVDADHSTAGVSEDIWNWHKKVKSGGRLIGHDYNMAAVRAAVESHFRDTVKTEDDHLWWVDC